MKRRCTQGRKACGGGGTRTRSGSPLGVFVRGALVLHPGGGNPGLGARAKPRAAQPSAPGFRCPPPRASGPQAGRINVTLSHTRRNQPQAFSLKTAAYKKSCTVRIGCQETSARRQAGSVGKGQFSADGAGRLDSPARQRDAGPSLRMRTHGPAKCTPDLHGAANPANRRETGEARPPSGHTAGSARRTFPPRGSAAGPGPEGTEPARSASEGGRREAGCWPGLRGLSLRAPGGASPRARGRKTPGGW